jgi:hypothetical protein
VSKVVPCMHAFFQHSWLVWKETLKRAHGRYTDGSVVTRYGTQAPSICPDRSDVLPECSHEVAHTCITLS